MTSRYTVGSPTGRTPFEMALDALSDEKPTRQLPVVKRVSLRRELSLVDEHPVLGFMVRMSEWALSSIKPDREDSVSLIATMPCGVWNVSLSFGHCLYMDDAGRRSSFSVMHFHTVEKTHQCCSDTTRVPMQTATGNVRFAFDLTKDEYVVDSLIMNDKFLELLGKYQDIDFVDIVIQLRKLLPGHLRFRG